MFIFGIIWRTIVDLFIVDYSTTRVPYPEFRTLLTRKTGLSPEVIDKKVKKHVINIFGDASLYKLKKIVTYYKEHNSLPYR